MLPADQLHRRAVPSQRRSASAVLARPRVRWWPTVEVPDEPAPELYAATHRSRRGLHAVLRDPDDEAAWGELARTYAAMAGEWSQWANVQAHYLTPLRVGLARARTPQWVLEVGCGTGQAGPVLEQCAAQTVSLDVNASMVALAPRSPRRSYAVADVRRLPFAAGSVPLIVGLNAVPHVREFQRVLAADGQVLWCASFGAGTPLYLTPEELLAAFGEGWTADAGRAGHGEWVLLRRPRPGEGRTVC